MELTKVNKLLINLNLNTNKDLEFVERQELEKPEGQGSYGEYYLVYKIISEKDMYIKITYVTDSYGENDIVSSIQFVKPKKVTITEFQTL